MAERVQGVSPKDIAPKPAEFTLKNEEGLKDLGFSDYEIGGGRRLEEARKILFEKPRSKGELQALKQWTEVKRADPTARKFQHLLEQAAALKRINKPEIREQAAAYLQRALSLRAETGPSGELLYSLGQALMGNELAVADPKVAKLLESLKAAEMVQDRAVSPIEAVTSPNITLITRAEWWNRRIAPAVNFVEWLDKQKSGEEETEKKKEAEPPEGESKPNETEDPEPQPPQRSKDHTPSMDDRQEAKEQKREKTADFTVSPGTRDFYEVNSWQKWDGKKWTSVATDGEYKRKHKKGGLNATVKGEAGNNETPIPLRKNEVVPKDSLDDLRRQGFKITADSAGHLFVSSGKGKTGFEAIATEGEEIKYSNWYKNLITRPKIESAPQPVRAELDRIMAAEKKSMGRAKAWQGFVQKWLTYANESKWNGVYQQSPDYFSAVGAGRIADCDVANTFFLLGCAQMGVDGELVGGYAVQKLDGTDAKLTPNDLHAVSRIFDPETKRLVVFDATPADPSQREEGKGKKEEGEGEGKESERKDVDGQEEGDPLDETEEDIPDEKELKKMEREIEAKEKAEQDAASKRVEAEEFAREAGCSEQEAQEVLDEIREAMDMTREDNRLIIDWLIQEFQKLVQDLVTSRITTRPLVTRSEGTELYDPVEAKIGMLTGSRDPLGWALQAEQKKKEKHYGGFRLVIVNDRSGSTDTPISVKDANQPTGRRRSTIIKEERRVNFLVMEALAMFQKMAERSRATMEPPPLNIETQILGFPGDNWDRPVSVIKPLSSELTNKDRLSTHRALSTSGGGTPDGEALRWIREQLTPADKNRLKEKDLLMIVIVNADGGSDSPENVRRELDELTQMGVVVRGRGLGRTVTEIVQTYAPHGSCGDIGTYPEFVAKEIIGGVQLLDPKRVKK